MKRRVEHCLHCTKGWVVLDADGRVEYESSIWEWAVEDAITRYNDEVERNLRSLFA
jgi:hypothetical protein